MERTIEMSTKYADDPATENARKQLEADKKVTERSRAEYAERAKGKPTPTQEELDMSMLGAHILEHEDDGGGPDPNDLVHREHTQTRHLESGGTSRPQSYATRQHTPKSE
jgi:hypothetical protein